MAARLAMSMSLECGCVYVATGTGYVEEALRSATSVREHHPTLPICLITDQSVTASAIFTTVQKPQGRVEHKPVDKLLALEAPYTRCLFLDTDTFALDDLSPIFALLDRFDLAALQDVNRGWNYQLPDVPVTFSEFNTGVLAFRRDAKLRELFQDWRTRYDALRQTYGFVNDQPAFRQALYHSTLRVAPLPNEFHFLGNFPNSTLWKVRLLHARGDYAKIGRDVNEVLGGRAYIPNVGVVPAYAGRRSWVKSTWQTFRRMAWLCLRAPADSAASNPRKWWLEERRPKS